MKKQHILLVDDVAKNIQIAANVLKQLDCQISFALSGEKALELLEREKIDLVLLDLMMPGMDGYEVCRKMKNDVSTKEIPVIFLTAKNDIESISLAFKSGGVDYISKPFNSEELLARVWTQLELKKAMQKIVDQNNRLERTNAVKDKLFSIIAHDLRNPFNGVLVLTDILKYKLDTMKTEEIRAKIEMIYTSSKDGYDLLENLLEWSRSQRDKLEFNPVLIDISTIISGNINLIKPLAIAKRVEILTDTDESTPLMADQHMVDSIIRNLITNAIKFTPENGKVKIKTQMLKDTVRISVKDSGVGIEERILKNLFEPDTQQSSIGTANERGTGLGLLLCKEFVDRHRGKIWVETHPNKGSNFIFTLPLTN